jgi:DNA-binding MarR family transcriptional regulator
MKRDWNIIRNILEDVDTSPAGSNEYVIVEWAPSTCRHVQLLAEGGLITISESTNGILHFIDILSITDKGRSFLARSRDESAWAQAMAVDSDYGGISFEILELLLDKYQQEIAPKTQRNLHNS